MNQAVNTNSQRQSVQWVGRRCRLAIYRSCAAGYDSRAATRPYRLEYVPIIIGKWYNMSNHCIGLLLGRFNSSTARSRHRLCRVLAETEFIGVHDSTRKVP